jgi:hypothetical protein
LSLPDTQAFKQSPGGCSLRRWRSDCIKRGCDWIDPDSDHGSNPAFSRFANGRCWPKDSDVLPLSPMHSDTHTVALYTLLGSFILPMPGVNVGSINMSWVWKGDADRTVIFLGPNLALEDDIRPTIAGLKPEHMCLTTCLGCSYHLCYCGRTLCNTTRHTSRNQANRPCVCVGDCWNRAVQTRSFRLRRVYASVPTVRTAIVPWDCSVRAPNSPAGTDHNRTVVVQRR